MAPATKLTLAVPLRPPGAGIESVFASALVDLIEPVAWPLESVTAAGWVNVLFDPVEASVTAWPGTGFPLASLRVTVTVLDAVPSAVSEPGAAEIVDWALESAPG